MGARARQRVSRDDQNGLGAHRAGSRYRPAPEEPPKSVGLTAVGHFTDALHPRDAKGKFIQTDAHVAIKGWGNGVVHGLNKDGTVTVKFSSGREGVFRPDDIHVIDSIATIHPPGGANETDGEASPHDELNALLSGGAIDTLLRGRSAGGFTSLSEGGGVNDSAFVQRDSDGKKFFIKTDTMTEEPGANAEQDASAFLRGLGLAAPTARANGSDVAMHLAGSEDGIEAKGDFSTLFPNQPRPRLESLGLADPKETLHAFMSDVLLSNFDRHNGNIMLGSGKDGNYLLPIDHGITLNSELGGPSHDSPSIPVDVRSELAAQLRHSTLSAAVRDHVRAAGDDQARADVADFMDRADQTLKALGPESFVDPGTHAYLARRLSALQEAGPDKVWNELNGSIKQIIEGTGPLSLRK